MRKIIGLIVLVCVMLSMSIPISAVEVNYGADAELQEMNSSISRRGDDDEVRDPPEYSMPYGGFVRYYINDGRTMVQILFLDRAGTRELITETNGNLSASFGSVISDVLFNLNFDDADNMFGSFTTLLDVISVSVAIQEGLVYADINEANGWTMIKTESSVSTGEVTKNPTVSGWHEHPNFQTPDDSTRWSCIVFPPSN